MWRQFWLPGILLLVALDGTAALAASALLRAAAARSAREWAHDHHAQSAPAPESLPAQTFAGQVGIALVAGEQGIEDSEIGMGATSRARRARRRPSAGRTPRSTSASRSRSRWARRSPGWWLPAFGAPAALLIDAASFVICGAMLLDLTPACRGRARPPRCARACATAWEYINDAATLRSAAARAGASRSCSSCSRRPIEVAYAKVSLHAGDSGYGVLLGVWGLGVAIGSVVFARSIKRSLGVLLSAGTLAVGLAYLGWAAAPTLALACAAGLIGGIGNGVQWAALISAVQRLTPQSLHGRMMGAVESLGAICPAIGLSLGGALAALSSPRGAFLVAGVGATLSTFAFVRLPLWRS